MPYTPYVKVSGTWQKMTINWTEVIGGPTELIDLNETAASRHVSDTEKSTWNGKVDSTRNLTAGSGLSGGGDLSADRTFNMDYAASTTIGGLKMRINGTDLFLRNDGTDA